MNICNEIFKHNKNNIAIISDKKITYGELDILSNKVANKLNKDFSINDRVVIQGDNSIEMAAFWLGMTKLGGVTVFVSNEHNSVMIENIIENSKSKKYFNNADLITFFNDIDNYDSYFETVNLDSSAICEITLTSGTSNFFQDVVEHSHEYTLFSIKQGMYFFDEPNSNDVIFGTAHLSFSFGIAGNFLMPLLFGASTILIKKPNILEMLEIIKNENVTYFFTAPSLYRLLSLHNPKDYFTDVKYSISGGDYLPNELRTIWKEKTDKYLTNIIGMAESQFVIACSIENDTPEDALGKIIPEYTLESSDDNSLIVKNNFISFTTSDNVEIKDDNLYLYGRNTDLISTTFGKYNPLTIEFIVLNSKLVNEVFALQYEKMNMKFIQLYCVGDKNNKEELKKYCKLVLPKELIPKKITYVDSLPKTITGKARRNTLKGLK